MCFLEGVDPFGLSSVDEAGASFDPEHAYPGQERLRFIGPLNLFRPRQSNGIENPHSPTETAKQFTS